MIELFFAAFVTFFVVIDPPGMAPVFASITEGGPKPWRRQMALRGCAVAAFVLAGFAFGGEGLLKALGVSLDAFRFAGGVLLFLIAIDMLFEKRTERRKDRADRVKHDLEDHPQDDISVFPLAIPLISGPGAITAIMLHMGKYDGIWAKLTVLSAAGLNIAICLVMFLAIDPVMKVIGPTVAAMITRIFGVILAALAAQMILTALKATLF